MQALGPLAAGELPPELGYGERAVAQLAATLLKLNQGDAAAAKQAGRGLLRGPVAGLHACLRGRACGVCSISGEGPV